MVSHRPNLSYVADASGGKPVQRRGCSCMHLPVGGGQIAAVLPGWPASDPPRDAGGRSATKTRGLRRRGPTERWAEDDQGPLGRSRGSGWPEQNLPESIGVSDGEQRVWLSDYLISSAPSLKQKRTLAKSRSACLRCLQNNTEDPECGLVTGSPYTNNRIRTPDTRTPFNSHTSIVGSIQSIQPHESAAENTFLINMLKISKDSFSFYTRYFSLYLQCPHRASSFPHDGKEQTLQLQLNYYFQMRRTGLPGGLGKGRRRWRHTAPSWCDPACPQHFRLLLSGSTCQHLAAEKRIICAS